MTQENPSRDDNTPATRAELAAGLEAVMAAFDAVVTTSQLDQRMVELKQHVSAEIRSAFKELVDHIDVAVENRQIDLGAAKAEQVQGIQEMQEAHEQRIAALEQQVGRAP